ncbi:CGNR zinc finger domain-containing protein [Actinocrispum wychmicini]|uniref:CGNR zinc finger protein n=1 Tax=Actinocrispum wychmicini TaxID=1213861 RepID=A0A4V6NP41_9PSEU|nr:CGNR zinc finger domain-containing protein [Actinocrispum wychmicini]TCO65620.1 CGNR zinc finger protein [Actinocrispum wychmicini]
MDGSWVRSETGATWLDLVATVSGAYGAAPRERLISVDLLGDWLATVHLRPAADPTEDDLERARALREALRGLALAVVRGERWPARHVRLVNEVLAEDRPLTLTGGHVRPPATCREALARIARQAAEHLAEPAALRQCADEVCGMLFIDPGGRRRWCSAEICGVRNRVRAHRRRNAPVTAQS